MEWKKGFMEVRVAIGMLAVQGFGVGLQILSRIILTQGTFIFALMTYRQIVGAICVAPLAFYHDRFVPHSLCCIYDTNYISLCLLFGLLQISFQETDEVSLFLAVHGRINRVSSFFCIATILPPLLSV